MSATRLWYPHYVRDFNAKTAHLSLAERGAYRALMDAYWEAQGPLPADERALCRMIGAFPDEWAEVRENVLAFFHEEGGLLVSGEIEAAIAAHKKKERARRREWAVLRKIVFERDDYTCSYCGVRGGDLECDHMEPWSAGGSDEIENLTTACRPCNRRKSNKGFDHWMQMIGAL